VETADLVLAIAVPLVAMLAGWVGVEMSLTPPERQTAEQRRNYRAAFILFMLLAIGLNIWQTARNAKQQNSAKDDYQRKQGELTNKVSEQGGKLDAIAHFEQQFLTFVSQAQRPAGGASDAQTKAYEAMALAVMKMAQGSAPQSPGNVHLQITYEGSELDGRTIDVALNNGTTNGAPNGQHGFQLAQFHIKNYGSSTSGAVSARLYFSKQLFGSGGWESTPSDESALPVAFYMGGGITPIHINAQETWNFPEFFGIVSSPPVVWEPGETIAVRLKVFYETDRPVIANFHIRRKKE
jgi:hypothetical protein